MSKIFEYCVAKDYNYEGFPKRYLSLIEADDPDFYDFLTFPVQEYFVTLMAKEHKDVFELVKLFNMQYTIHKENGFGMSDLEETIQFCSMSESFIFNRSDWRTPPKATRPKWPG